MSTPQTVRLLVRIALTAHSTNQSAYGVVFLMGLMTTRHYEMRVKVGNIEPWAHYQCP
jgi:hypothetical protein